MDTFLLKSGEEIQFRTKVSTAALIMEWLSVPILVLLPYWPVIHSGLLRLLWLLIPPLRKPIFFFSCGITLFLLLIWVCICLVRMRQHNGRMILTDCRIWGRQGRNFWEESISDVVDVHIEQSLLGKLFFYGTLTIITNGVNFTVRNLAHADLLRAKILLAANIRYYH